MLVQLAARLLRPPPSCLGLGSAPGHWLRCCPPLPRSAKVHQVQILKGRLRCACAGACACASCLATCCLLPAAPIVRSLYLVQLASYLATLHYITLPAFPAGPSVLHRHRNSTTSHLPGPSVLPRHTLNILCDFVQRTIDDHSRRFDYAAAERSLAALPAAISVLPTLLGTNTHQLSDYQITNRASRLSRRTVSVALASSGLPGHRCPFLGSPAYNSMRPVVLQPTSSVC